MSMLCHRVRNAGQLSIINSIETAMTPNADRTRFMAQGRRHLRYSRKRDGSLGELSQMQCLHSPYLETRRKRSQQSSSDR